MVQTRIKEFKKLFNFALQMLSGQIKEDWKMVTFDCSMWKWIPFTLDDSMKYRLVLFPYDFCDGIKSFLNNITPFSPHVES